MEPVAATTVPKMEDFIFRALLAQQQQLISSLSNESVPLPPLEHFIGTSFIKYRDRPNLTAQFSEAKNLTGVDHIQLSASKIMSKSTLDYLMKACHRDLMSNDLYNDDYYFIHFRSQTPESVSSVPLPLQYRKPPIPNITLNSSESILHQQEEFVNQSSRLWENSHKVLGRKDKFSVAHPRMLISMDEISSTIDEDDVSSNSSPYSSKLWNVRIVIDKAWNIISRLDDLANYQAQTREDDPSIESHKNELLNEARSCIGLNDQVALLPSICQFSKGIKLITKYLSIDFMSSIIPLLVTVILSKMPDELNDEVRRAEVDLFKLLTARPTSAYDFDLMQSLIFLNSQLTAVGNKTMTKSIQRSLMYRPRADFIQHVIRQHHQDKDNQWQGQVKVFMAIIS